jgi:hypothetical protein
MHSQIVNFGLDAVSLTISTTGIEGSINALGSTATVLTSGNVMDENSFTNPNKVLHHLHLHSYQCVEPVVVGYDVTPRL